MPSVIVNSQNINTFSFNATFDIANRQLIFDTSNSIYNNGSASGIMFVEGISFSVVDSVGVVLASIDFTNPANYIVPGVTQIFTLDLSNLNFAFLFQAYTIVGAIKDQSGLIYQTVPVYPNVCMPTGINEDGYVDGSYQITPNCANNTLSVSEVTLLVYNNQRPATVIKNGTLYYPTGTISPVTFTGTPFANNVVYTGQYRIYNTTAGTYDISNGNGIYVSVTYLTDAVFDIQCGSKMNDLFCCIEGVQRTAIKNCNNAIGANARQQLLEISTYFMSGILAEIVGQDASFQYEYIRKALSCNCGVNSIRQNELNPINPSVYSILVVGSNNTTVTPSQNGSTKTYTVSSPYYVVSKGITGDLSFTITPITTVANTTNYQITFNYGVMAGYILTAIGNSPSLIAQLNSLVAATTNIDLTTLDGGCVIDLSNINYFLAYLTPNAASTFNSITFGATTYTPGVPILCSNTAGILSYINGLSLGVFTASYTNGYFNLLTNTNANSPVSVTLGINSAPVVVPFQKTTYSLIAVLQAVIDYLCNLTALQVALGNNLSLCDFDYNGNVVTTNYAPTQKQNDFNEGISAAICSIVARINTLTGITCSKITSLFQDYPNATFNNATDRYLSVVGGNCTTLTGQQQALAFINAVNSYTDVKAAFCAISCTTPATCPDVSATSLSALSSSSIGLYGLTWSATPTASQTVTVRYQLAGGSSWTTATNSLLISPNGNISGTTPFQITGLTAGATYNIQVQNNCGGNGFINQITVPTAGVSSGSYLVDSVIYNVCGDSPITLYSSIPFNVGVQMFYDPALTSPVTGFNYIVPVSTGTTIFNLDPTSGTVGASTGSPCTSGIAGSYKVANDTTSICSDSTITLYTDGVFAVGGTLYTDSGLTTPKTGSTYVFRVADGVIYNLNTSTGQVGSSTGLGCVNTHAVGIRMISGNSYWTNRSAACSAKTSGGCGFTIGTVYVRNVDYASYIGGGVAVTAYADAAGTVFYTDNSIPPFSTKERMLYVSDCVPNIWQTNGSGVVSITQDTPC